MKRIFVLSAVVCLIGIFAVITPVRAQYVGNFCWNMSPYVDNIEVAVTQNGGTFALHGLYRAPGSYSIACHGTVVADPVHGGFDFAMTCEDGVDSPSWIAWHIHGKLGAGLTGPWTFYRVADGYTVSGTLVPTSCPVPLSGTDVSGTAANE